MVNVGRTLRDHQGLELLFAWKQARLKGVILMSLLLSGGFNGEVTVEDIPDDTPAIPTASLSFSDSTAYQYGTFGLGVATDHTFTVTNSGNADATQLVASNLTSPFVYKGWDLSRYCRNLWHHFKLCSGLHYCRHIHANRSRDF